MSDPDVIIEVYIDAPAWAFDDGQAKPLGTVSIFMQGRFIYCSTDRKLAMKMAHSINAAIKRCGVRSRLELPSKIKSGL